ncbi:hypothetical protein [Natrinema longum]|uniref:Uncharacterized protein n=1 Tax=Natrinema longum TaxID=370324 RepID=A0A8A2UCX4_9EURY|nr:hypothetical protein [Natrinema longum]MBZ6495461.1 hypothetical protein [Natrinema longum]QSW86569.1 hypothetical protein J0X27_07065 [Natrinema longum]
MGGNLRRRDFLASTPIFLSTLAGCSVLQNESRILQTMVVNHTDEDIEVQLVVIRDGENIIEQRFGLPPQSRDTSNFSSKSRMKIENLSEGSKLKASIIVDGNRKETTNIVIDCDSDAAGDNIGFRVYDEYIDAKGGCAAARNILNAK